MHCGRSNVPRYMNLWEIDDSKVPTDPKERLALLMKMTEMTKQTLKEHPGTEWGIFLGENKGFSVSSSNATWQDMQKTTQTFAPYVKSEVCQVLSIEEAEQVLKSMMSQ